MIDRATIQRIMDATDIVDVVKEFVTLRKAGVNYKGLCPFHNEKTPSFTVSPSKQLCKCFSCGVGGNAVHFLMKLEQMTYPEAIKWLGKKYGIEVIEKEITDEEKQAQSERESLFAVNEWANKYFQNILHNDVDGVAKGLAYFRSRGFRDDIIRKFQLGYSLEDRDAMTKAAIAHGFNDNYLVKTGISYKTDDGRLHDRYHGRVIFPVHTVSGRTVAFGGRILNTDKKLAKYVNSPESEIYSKSRELYGIYQSKSAIIREGRCFLVEGYTDVISMHQCGVENVVASSGTSLTEGQIRLLHRFTNNITVLYDGDSAGIKASLRGIDMLLSEGLNIKVLLLPNGEDPDSFARAHRADEFKKFIDDHQVDFIKFKTDLLLKDAEKDPIKRAEFISDIVKSISVIPDNIVRQMYITECASQMSVSEELVINEINRQHRNQSKFDAKTTSDKEQSSEPENSIAPLNADLNSIEEKQLVAMIVRYANLPINISIGPEVEDTDEELKSPNVVEFIASNLNEDGIVFRNPLYQRILNEALEQSRANDNWESLPYFLHHTDIGISQLAVEIGNDDFVLSSHQREQFVEDKYHLEEIVPRLIHDYKHSLLKERLKKILNELKDPQLQQDSEKYQKVMRSYMELSAIDRQFAQILGDRVILK